MSTEKKTVPIRLLLVDDEVEFLESTSRALTRRGINVETAADADAAMALLQRQEFDVAVLDVLMPGMTGDDLFRWIKRAHPDLPVIMLTGHGTVQQAFQVSREGVFDYLTKPCDVEQVARVAREAASGRSAHSAAADLAADDEVRLLIVDDEVEFLGSLSKALERRGMRVSTAANCDETLVLLEHRIFDVALLDVKLPDIDGIDLLHRVKEAQPTTEVILLTGHPTVETGVEGIRCGAFNFLTKPCDTEFLARKIREAYASVRTKRKAARRKGVEDLLKGRSE